MAKILTGTVSSISPDKTIVISIVMHRTHPIYKKRFVTSKKFMAHDENNECRVGDLVSIVETKPISARKRFKLNEVIEKAELTREELSAIEADEPKKEAVSRETKDMSQNDSAKSKKSTKPQGSSPKSKDSKPEVSK